MNKKRITEVGTAWCCGVALGALYTAKKAYVATAYSAIQQPEWFSDVETLVTAMIVCMALGVAGIAYETYQEVENDE